ncbi:Uncharacterised protein [Kluyvera cryocrescens]|uniref:Uncharacterized protein n=1 Tax=Kluyvera cryocrescens TaxID=580 RepID=A0A485AV22_KLUCR|nr:Uncharacterised protein [Kluyvera cryocrescens]
MLTLASVIAPGDTLLTADRYTGTLNFTDGHIHALQPEAGGYAVMPALFPLNGSALDLHCLCGYCHCFFRTALRHVVLVILFKPG